MAACAVAPVEPEPIIRQDGEKRKRGRPRKDAKAKAVKIAEGLDISCRTVERSFAEAEGKTPQPGKPKLVEKPVATPPPGCEVVAGKIMLAGTADYDDGADLDHFLKNSDPVALATRIIETMDAEQLKQISAVIDRAKQKLGRKRGSRIAADGGDVDFRGDPISENIGAVR